MNRGDTITFVLDFRIDGEPLREGQFDEIELQLNRDSERNSIKWLLSEGRIVWGGEYYYVEPTQEETMKLSITTKYQLRLAIDGKVVSSTIGMFYLGDVLSEKIL